MKLKTTLFIVLIATCCLSCKQETTFQDYKYADQPQVINCLDLDGKLYDEALYSFEDDILNYYNQQGKNPSLLSAYNRFLRSSLYSNTPYEEIISEHTLKVFKALKADADLWDESNSKSRLNYNSKLVECLAENINNKNLKTTFNALISTNSMSPKLFGTPLLAKYRNVSLDKHLAAYVAFDLYYAKLYDFDLTKLNFNQTEATPETK